MEFRLKGTGQAYVSKSQSSKVGVQVFENLQRQIWLAPLSGEHLGIGLVILVWVQDEISRPVDVKLQERKQMLIALSASFLKTPFHKGYAPSVSYSARILGGLGDFAELETSGLPFTLSTNVA